MTKVLNKTAGPKSFVYFIRNLPNMNTIYAAIIREHLKSNVLKVKIIFKQNEVCVLKNIFNTIFKI